MYVHLTQIKVPTVATLTQPLCESSVTIISPAHIKGKGATVLTA